MKRALALLLLIATPSPVIAQAPPTARWTVEGAVGVVSDYRYRGASLSGGAALQGGLTATHAAGFYGDIFFSTIEVYGVGEDGDGAEQEATLTLGWAGATGGLDVDIALSTYRYPDGSDVDYHEFPVQVGRTWGAATWTIGAAWAPSGQAALEDQENRYVWGGLDLASEDWPIVLRGMVGVEKGAYAPAGKTDWLVGLAAPVGPLALGLDYVDSDADAGAWVASVFVAF